MNALLPLRSVKILDLSRLLPGPFATRVLADMGATVDKIEDTGPGDYLRHLPPLGPDGVNAAFFQLNAGKRSATLDLKHEEGRATLLEMLAHYDVLFEQFRPGVLARLGLDPKDLCERFPRLIVCSVTGYGQTGPLAHRAGHDLNYIARSGVLGACGPDGGPPQMPGFQLADISGALWSVIAILGALRSRDETGRGAHLDIAMSECTTPFAIMGLSAAIAGHAPKGGADLLTGGIAPYAVYATKDGRAVTLATLEPKFWLAFAARWSLEASLGDLIPGPHQIALREKLTAIFNEKTRDEWSAWSAEHDLLIEPVLSFEEALSDAHLAARGVFEGPRRLINTPVSPRDRADVPAAPTGSRDARKIFREAGISDERIATLFQLGVSRAPDDGAA
jgi:alpha-methylacyl-CoA racemase